MITINQIIPKHFTIDNHKQSFIPIFQKPKKNACNNKIFSIDISAEIILNNACPSEFSIIAAVGELSKTEAVGRRSRKT